ncbi:MAG: hypothetical protein CW341_00200 [Bacteroidetes bacterium]|nr:hypothetical protein [Bacteroidota bacterium]
MKNSESRITATNSFVVFELHQQFAFTGTVVAIKVKIFEEIYEVELSKNHKRFSKVQWRSRSSKNNISVFSLK